MNALNVHSNIAEAHAAIEKANACREMAIDGAFLTLQKRNPLLAETLLEGFRDSRKAAHWMCLHQQVFEGKNAYEVLIGGQDDLIWDEVLRSVIRMGESMLTR